MVENKGKTKDSEARNDLDDSQASIVNNGCRQLVHLNIES